MDNMDLRQVFQRVLSEDDSDTEVGKKIDRWMLKTAVEYVRKIYRVTLVKPRVIQSLPQTGFWVVKGKNPKRKANWISDYEIVMHLTSFDPTSEEGVIEVTVIPWW